MFWADKLISKLNKHQPHIVNDSKTPSGQAHVGALRGVLIHDVMFRVMKERGFDVCYTFGVDDYDPLDELPYGKDRQFEPYLGMPLCNVPPPPGSDASDMSDYYISEFFGVFKDLGVEVETYRMRDVYRSGRFDEAIDTILQHADVVRHVYKKVSGSERPANWYPFQTVCENCGRIGTTEVTDYDGKEVTYTCRPDLVTWARGCGHQGKVSPFSGKGKLPWKLEWVAKWAVMGITVEGAGKDHTTKGGSRDVASHCLKAIFKKSAPLNIPYEFFLVGGAKMSSSRGIGAAARDMANLLPPEILRFLMLRPPPNRPINFSPDEQSIIKLFNEYDRTHAKVFDDPKVPDETREVYRLSEVKPEGNYYTANIQLLQALVQMPHLDVVAEIRKRKEGDLSDTDLAHIQQRIASVRYWLDNIAKEEERMQLQDTLPAKAQALTATQRAFLHRLANSLPDSEWQGEKLQATIFNAARSTPIAQSVAFAAIYAVLFARDAGPRAGNLFEFLDLGFLVQRFRELDYAQTDYWRETGITPEALAEQLQKLQPKLKAISAQTLGDGDLGGVEFAVTLNDDKTHCLRVVFDSAGADFENQAVALIKEVKEQYVAE